MSYLNLTQNGGVPYISVQLNPEKVVNMIKLSFPGNQRFQNGLVIRPGYSSWSAAVGSSVRGLAPDSDNATGYVVDGNTFYSVAANGTRTSRGTLSSSTGYVDIIIGRDNVFINPTTNDTGYVYVPSTNAFSAITDPDFPDLIKATYQDTYFLGIERNSSRIWHSANDDASSWSALAFATAESQPDDAVNIISFDRNLYILKKQTTEFWFNSGETFPFNPTEFVNLGCAATNGVTWVGEFVYFVCQNQQKICEIYKVNNQFLPQKVSTQSIDSALTALTTVSDAEAFAFTLLGNELVIFTFPTGDLTLVYNATTDSWSEFQASDGTYYPFSHYMRIGNKHIIGASTGGALYQTSYSIIDDAGTDFNWQLITPTLYSEGRWLAPDRIRVDLDDVAANAAVITLQTSTQGGSSFSTSRNRTVTTGLQVSWNIPASSDMLTYSLSGASTHTIRLFNWSTEIAIGGYR